MLPQELLKTLPYGSEFLFAREITEVSEKCIRGKCFFPSSHPACLGHFRDEPLLPGVIMLEGMGQIALVAHALYLGGDPAAYTPVLHSIEAEFHLTAPADTLLMAEGEPVYFRNLTLRSKMRLFDEEGREYVTANGLLKLIPKNR